MKLLKIYFEKVLVFKLNKFYDKRGNFYESYNKKKLKNYFKENFSHDAISVNKKNVFRGLHYQTKFKQGKLINVIEGKILDIIVDLRKKSPTYLKFKKIILSESNSKMIYVPKGYAHGFLVLSKKAIISYKISKEYKKKYEKTLSLNDSKLKLDLPKHYQKKIIISKKDSEKKS